jgi:hypothetical protein
VRELRFGIERRWRDFKIAGSVPKPELNFGIRSYGKTVLHTHCDSAFAYNIGNIVNLLVYNGIVGVSDTNYEL